jgi:prepilin-type N-terminal cleavage/methylation domain-containing protein
MGGVIFLNSRESESGFTLIEVIVTIVVISILATMLYTYFGSAITQSAAPLIRLGSTIQLQNVMENITADYLNTYSKTTSNLLTIQSGIGTEGSTQNNLYGQYTVIDNHFIKFDAGNQEQPDTGGSPANNLLKVTIKDSFGNTLTALFHYSST